MFFKIAIYSKLDQVQGTVAHGSLFLTQYTYIYAIYYLIRKRNSSDARLASLAPNKGSLALQATLFENFFKKSSDARTEQTQLGPHTNLNFCHFENVREFDKRGILAHFSKKVISARRPSKLVQCT